MKWPKLEEDLKLWTEGGENIYVLQKISVPVKGRCNKGERKVTFEEVGLDLSTVFFPEWS